jgi:Lrp/AsnC family transcriptional regulator for asnA, asnC and gidA
LLVAYRVDSLDQEIIRRLQADGRASNVDIARALGVAEATIRKRLERLTKEGFVTFSASVRCGHIGLQAQAIIFLKVAVGEVEKVARALAALSEVCSVHLITGEYELMAEAVFADNAGLSRFLTEKLTTIPGALSLSTWQILDTYKEAAHWVLPEEAPPRILVVDDDPDFVEIVRQVLQGEHMDVVSAGTAEDALARARAMVPDLIIMDVMMRGILDGVEATRNLKTEKGLADVPILMITSMPRSQYAEFFPIGEELPIDQLITKPVSPAALASEVKRLLKRP